MRNRLVLTSLSTAMILAACNRASTRDEQLQKDLEAASVGALELAPNRPGTNVVSALESKQPIRPKITPSRRPIPPVHEPVPQPPTHQVTQASADPVAATSRQLPASSVSTPRNPKTMGQVIRNAPFPINPATKQP